MLSKAMCSRCAAISKAKHVFPLTSAMQGTQQVMSTHVSWLPKIQQFIS